MKKIHTALFLSAVIILSAAALTASAADLREDGDAAGVAVPERALEVEQEKALAAQEVAFIGDKEYEAELAAKAADAGIKLLHVPVQ